MSSTQPAAGEQARASRITADHPGVDKLFGLLAYGEVAAFYRLTEEARMAPNLAGRINMAAMAAAEMGHYELPEMRWSAEASTLSRRCRSTPRRSRTTTA